MLKNSFRLLLLAPLFLLGASCNNQSANQPSNNQANNQAMSEIKRTTILMQTNKGDIKIQLYDDLAPKTVKNILDLIGKGFYDGILFHRVIPGFMIQAGDPLTKSDPKNWAEHGTGGPGYTIDDEFNNLPFKRGALGMAKTQAPNSGGSQFFIVVKDSTFLNGQYTNFGEVLSGMDVADAIAAAPRDDNDHPLEDIKIEKITVVQ